MSYAKKTLTISEEQYKYIEQRNLKLSKVTQKAIDEIIQKEAQAWSFLKTPRSGNSPHMQ